MTVQKQPPEAEAFIARITALPEGPGVDLSAALQPSLDDEAELRKLFATDKGNARLQDPYVGLVDVFAAPEDIRVTRARIVKDENDLVEKHVMPISESTRKKEGAPAMVQDLEEFKKNWSVFTEGSLSQLKDWNNVVAAGGSVLACLSPLTDDQKESKRSMRKYYHASAYPTSDVDLFLWGMTPEQAEIKMNKIYEAVRDSVPWDVTCIRTKHTVSIHSQYPYRSVQIVLRLYQSPAEILAGFDVDAPCFLYNGDRVLGNPRGIVAMMRQCNTVDMTRRSPSYEVRLAKYSTRGFEVYVPTLERPNIDPTIYERSITRIEGLARLLVLEKLMDPNTRNAFLDSRRELRGRPPVYRYVRHKRKYKGDLKVDNSIVSLEMNDYDVASLHIPYGPGWDARRIDKLVYSTDLGMNSTFNPKNKNRRLHRHPAFFGTMKECTEDCCENCPEPVDSDEKELQSQEDEIYIRGRISFIQEDPGRQSMSGSFNPIDVGEWSAQVYIGQTEHFFAAVAALDREGVANIIKQGVDVNRRDHVGRSALHLAISCRASDIACDLIDAGARITARLVDGRTPLHLAAQHDVLDVVKKLLERSELNRKQAERLDKSDDATDEAMHVDPARPSSEDDWSSEADNVIAMDTDQDIDDLGGNGTKGSRSDEDNEDADDEDDDGDDEDEGEADGDEDDDGERKRVAKPAEKTPPAQDSNDTTDFPEDKDESDIIDINIADWDLDYTPLAYAVLLASLPVIKLLLEAGADEQLKNPPLDTMHHPLTLTLQREKQDDAPEIVQCLLSHGASSSAANDDTLTIFNRAVLADNREVISSLMSKDPNAETVIGFPSITHAIVYPVGNAIAQGHYATAALLIAHGTKLSVTGEDIDKLIAVVPRNKRTWFRRYNTTTGLEALQNVFLPLETAISVYDDVAQLLISLGVDMDVGIQSSRYYGNSEGNRNLLDWVQYSISFLQLKLEQYKGVVSASSPVLEPASFGDAKSWKNYYLRFEYEKKLKLAESSFTADRRKVELKKSEEVLQYLADIETALLRNGAKTWNETYPDNPSPAPPTAGLTQLRQYETYPWKELSGDTPAQYAIITRHDKIFVTQNLTAAYDELFEACFTGNNEKIENLCLPSEDGEDGGQGARMPLSVYTEISEENRYARSGLTPLFAAACGRQWETCKLLLAIAAAQYEPEADEPKWSADDINLVGDDSDNDSDDSNDSDITVEQTKPTLIDVAQRPSSVQSELGPKWLLDEARAQWTVKLSETRYMIDSGNLIFKAVKDKDWEFFKTVMDLYKTSPLPVPLSSKRQLLEEIIRNDQVEMLDEFIRRTGQGIDLDQEHKESAGAQATNDANRLYLGLSVHGKKRVDLAKKNDPNAVHESAAHPLLWLAANSHASNVIDYLTTDRPLEAYRFFASRGGDELAFRLRRVPELDKLLPQWLGWRISQLGESPLAAAIAGRDISIVKELFARKPKLMASTLHERIKFVGYNPLMLAVYFRCDVAMIDFLLKKSISPLETELTRGWNIYHILCDGNNADLLEHFLKKLPKDINEIMLLRQSKIRLSTPLHLAVKKASIRAVELIARYMPSCLLVRNVDGSTALHIAVQKGFTKIAKILVDAAPEMLTIENGVGESPLDIADARCLSERKYSFEQAQRGSIQPGQLHTGNISVDPTPKRFDVKHLEAELPKLRSTIDELDKQGLLKGNEKLAKALNDFAEMMEGHLRKAKEAESKNGTTKPEAEEPTNPLDYIDREGTQRFIAEAVQNASLKRQLVRLVDVQKSVQGNLATPRRYHHWRNHEDKGLEEKVEEEEEARGKSMILGQINKDPEET